MRANLAALSFSIFVGAAVCSAQTAPEAVTPAPPQPDYSYIYCSGFISDPKVPDDTRLISGEQSNYKTVFARGEYVYINRGEDKGVKVGDRRLVHPWIGCGDCVVCRKGEEQLCRENATQTYLVKPQSLRA